jgi:hypothetical protein
MFGLIVEIAENIARPLQLLFLSAIYLPNTLFSILWTRQFSTLISPSRFRYAWFARFWSVYGPIMKENAAPRVAPMIGLAKGVVLDIGPGSGEWIGLFDTKKVTKVFLLFR